MGKKLEFATSKRERAGYYSYFIGQNIVYIFVTLYLSVYYTTALGIPAGVVGTILLVARVWDAINDPMLSIFVEKARFKGGKFKPWIKAVAILVPVATVLIFAFTDTVAAAPMALRIAYATTTYIAWGMLYTISDAPAFALATVMTHNMDERNIIMSLSRMFAMVGIFIAMIGGPAILGSLGNSWVLTALILSVIGFLFMIQVAAAKERVKSDQESPKLKDILGAIFKNRYLMIFVIAIVVTNGFNFGMTITPFIANDVFKNPNATSAIMAIGLLPMLIAAPLLPRLVRKFGKINIFRYSMLSIVVFSLIMYFVGYSNFTIFLVLSLLKGILGGFSMVIGSLFFADCIEFDYFTKGTRFEAATFAAQTFSNKATAAISGAGAMWLLAMFGFKEAVAGEVVVQSQKVVDGMWAIFNLGPAFGALVALVIFWKFYDLTEDKLISLSKK